jgi:hypothetical protein
MTKFHIHLQLSALPGGLRPFGPPRDTRTSNKPLLGGQHPPPQPRYLDFSKSRTGGWEGGLVRVWVRVIRVLLRVVRVRVRVIQVRVRLIRVLLRVVRVLVRLIRVRVRLIRVLIRVV